MVLQGANRDRFEELATPRHFLCGNTVGLGFIFFLKFCCGVGSSAVATCMWAGSPYKSLKCSCSEFGVGCEAGRGAGTCSRNASSWVELYMIYIYIYIFF